MKGSEFNKNDILIQGMILGMKSMGVIYTGVDDNYIYFTLNPDHGFDEIKLKRAERVYLQTYGLKIKLNEKTG